MKIYLQENVLNPTLLKRYVFVNGPSKERFRYITRYLENKLIKRHENIKEQYSFHKTNHMIIDTSAKWSRECIMMYPMGLIKRLKDLNEKFFEHKIESVRIMFILDERLRLNLTFQHIYFGFQNLHDCSVGEVRVISHSPNMQVFKYCGIHSNLINYPQNKNVSIILTSLADPSPNHIYDVIVLFSVIDTKRIVSLPKLRSLWTNLVWNLYLEQNTIGAMRFQLTTTKHQIFIINFTVNSQATIDLFDGPGTLSPNIYLCNQESYTTSTFQCAIHLWTPFTENLERECGFTFVTMPSNISKKIKMSNFLTHTISHELTNSKIWKIFSNVHLKLTIKTIMYTGYNDPICTFAGISVYSANKDTEITNDCFSFYDFNIDKDIYPSSNVTLLVLYSYKEYGDLNITMQLSTTQCKPVTIDTCALTHLCKYPNTIMCKEHREQIKSLNLNYTKISKEFPLSVNPGQCFILQMVAFIYKLKYYTSCSIKFHHIDIFKRKIKIQFNIKAFFHGKYWLFDIIVLSQFIPKEED